MSVLPEPPRRAMRNDAQFLAASEVWMRHLYEIMQVEEAGGVLARLLSLEAAANDHGARLGTLEAVHATAKEVEALTQSITNPPTQAEVEAIRDKVNELIGAFD